MTLKNMNNNSGKSMTPKELNNFWMMMKRRNDKHRQIYSEKKAVELVEVLLIFFFLGG